MVTSTVRPPRATPAPVPTPDRGSTSLKISTAPRPMAPMPNRMAEAVATRLAAPVGRRTRASPYGVQTAPGPFVFDREDDQRKEDHEQTRPGRHQQHHADGEDNGTHDGDGDPAEQSDQVHASRMPGAGEPETHGLGAAAPTDSEARPARRYGRAVASPGRAPSPLRAGALMTRMLGSPPTLWLPDRGAGTAVAGPHSSASRRVRDKCRREANHAAG